MNDIAVASIQHSTAQVQQAAQIDMLKKANDTNVSLAAELLASTQVVPPAPANPPGIGGLIDRRA